MKENKLLSINIYWLIAIYVVCCVLAFFVSTAIGIITTSITVASFIIYMFAFNKLKKELKKKNKDEEIS